MQQLILLASPTLRRGPLSALQRFVRDYEVFLRRFEIITTQGCRRALLRAGLLHGHPHLDAPLPGYLGAIVHLSSLVVHHAERIQAVVYLIDPRDPSSMFPETNAIKRECVVHRVTFLSTSRAAREWAAINWSESLPIFATSVDTAGLSLVPPLEEETIALVAHDGKKRELLEFARDHFDFLLRFRHRVATGTTGSLLNGESPDPERLGQAECDELAPVCDELRSRIDEARRSNRLPQDTPFVDRKESGPKGGDVAIAEMVLTGKCQRIMFFENPFKPHEHTEDIQLLERSGRLRGKSTICVHDHETAARFVKHWESSGGVSHPRVLLSFVVERLFGTRCIVVPTKSTWRDTWQSLREAAGWFLLSHIATLANERRKVSERVRVAVSWGVGASQIVSEMWSRLERLEVIDQQVQARPSINRDELEDIVGYSSSGGDYQFQTSSLGDHRYFRPGNVVVAPIQGLVGSEDEHAEANEVAYRLTELFLGDHLPLPANVLVRKGGDVERRRRRFAEVYTHWSNTDVVLATAGPLVEEYEDRPHTPHFPGFTEEMRGLGACGNVGSLYLDKWGKEVVPDRFEPTSMTAEQIRGVHARHGVVVVAGAQQDRLPITLAALIGGWISVLITDAEFARALVQQLVSMVRDGRIKIRRSDQDGPLVELSRSW
jgi:methylglyoxal synthase